MAGIVAGLLFTPARRYLKSGWFWAGAALAFLIFLPNFIWLARHNWVSYTFLQHIHARDVDEGRANGFLTGQFLVCANLAATLLWLAGLNPLSAQSPLPNARCNVPGPAYALCIAKGRHYYTAPPIPCCSQWAPWSPSAGSEPAPLGPHHRRERLLRRLRLVSAYVCALLVPLASSGPLKDFALRRNCDLREEFGWDELVRTVARIRDSLPLDQQAHLGIATGNYGEYGAIDILGSAYGLPAPIGTTNSEWLRGYPTPPPTTIIVLGNSWERADELFTNCRLAGHNGNSEGVRNEESVDHPDIFVCGPPRKPWPQIWKGHQDFG